MAKVTFQRLTTKRVIAEAPPLKYIAFYHSTEQRLNVCMRDYADRSFVYILSAMYEGREYFLYVGKTKVQYARHLTHSKKYAYSQLRCCWKVEMDLGKFRDGAAHDLLAGCQQWLIIK